MLQPPETLTYFKNAERALGPNFLNARPAPRCPHPMKNKTPPFQCSVALLGGCIGGGAGLLGCSGIVLLSSKGQAVWVAPRTADGRAVDLEPPETSSPIAVEEWRGALLDVRGVRTAAGGGGSCSTKPTVRELYAMIPPGPKYLHDEDGLLLLRWELWLWW